jgi:archaellum component FlaC
MNRIVVTAAVVCAILLVGGCQPREGQQDPALKTLKKETSEAWETTEDYLAQKRDEFERHIESELPELEQRISQLRERAAKASERIRPELQEKIDALEQKGEVARQKLAELKSKTGDAWQEAQPHLEASMRELKEAYDSASAEFDKEEG